MRNPLTEESIEARAREMVRPHKTSVSRRMAGLPQTAQPQPTTQEPFELRAEKVVNNLSPEEREKLWDLLLNSEKRSDVTFASEEVEELPEEDDEDEFDLDSYLPEPTPEEAPAETRPEMIAASQTPSHLGTDIDPAVAARAAQLQQKAEAVEVGAPYGRDANGRPNVPGFTTDPVVQGDLFEKPAQGMKPDGEIKRENFKTMHEYTKAKMRAGELVV